MRTFSGSDTEVVTIHASQDRVIAALTDPDQIKEALSEQLESGTTIDAHTAHWVRRSVEEVGVRFRGDYTVQYEHDGHGTIRWHTLGNGNMRTSGEAHVASIDETNTRLEYTEAIECDMDVNRFIAPVLKPIVERKIKQGIGTYVAKLKQVIERS